MEGGREGRDCVGYLIIAQSAFGLRMKQKALNEKGADAISEKSHKRRFSQNIPLHHNTTTTRTKSGLTGNPETHLTR